MDGYEIHDGRLLQQHATISAADALLVLGQIVPANKLWTVLLGLYIPSAAETRTVWWSIYTIGGVQFPVGIPAAIALSSTIPLPLLTEGMELKLWPGDRLRVSRDVATAGSTMTIYYRFIETDLPYYSYIEPLNKVIRRSQQHGSAYRSGGGISPGSPGSGGGSPGRGGEGGGRGPEPL
jgi:uncharacterized membrane protein YgcG